MVPSDAVIKGYLTSALPSSNTDAVLRDLVAALSSWMANTWRQFETGIAIRPVTVTEARGIPQGPLASGTVQISAGTVSTGMGWKTLAGTFSNPRMTNAPESTRQKQLVEVIAMAIDDGFTGWLNTFEARLNATGGVLTSRAAVPPAQPAMPGTWAGGLVPPMPLAGARSAGDAGMTADGLARAMEGRFRADPRLGAINPPTTALLKGVAQGFRQAYELWKSSSLLMGTLTNGGVATPEGVVVGAIVTVRIQ